MNSILTHAARTVVCSICLTVLAGLTAEAAVVATATLVKDPANGIPFAAPDQALGAPWVSYLLGIQSTAGEFLGAVDVEIHGTFHQRWNDSDSDGVFEPSANSFNTTNGDSHLIVPTGTLMCPCPSEDNSGSGSPLPDTPTMNYGLGTFLEAPWGIPGHVTSTNLAYVVIPRGTEPELDIRARVADINGDIIAELGSADFFVPEPASAFLCLLAFGGLICVARRKKR